MRGVIRFGGGEVVAPDDGPKPSLAFLTNGVEEVRINTNVNAATKVCARERTLDVSVVCDASFSISSLCLPLCLGKMMQSSMTTARSASS